MAQPAYDRSVVIYVDLCCVLEEFHLSDKLRYNTNTLQYNIVLHTIIYTPTFHDIYGFPYFFSPSTFIIYFISRRI